MMIWKTKPNLETLQDFSKNTMVEHLGIEFVEAGEDFMIAKMPVDDRTVQPMRLLHGGASVALAETLGSVASTFCVDDLQTKSVVGVEINANHLKAVKSGFVFGKVYPIRIGRTIHVWQIDIRDEAGDLTCVSRLTVAVLVR